MKNHLVSTTRLVARAQISITLVWVVCLFATLFVFMFAGVDKMPATAQKVLDEWSHFLRDATFAIIYFWFQRLREGGAEPQPQPAGGPPEPVPTLPQNAAQPAAGEKKS